jgi:hypothetical protein
VPSTVIYYSNGYDLEKRLQSEDRAHRIGQKKSVTYVDLIAAKTVDEKIVKALRSKIRYCFYNIMGEELKRVDMKYLIGIIFIINSETHVEWRTIHTDCQSWWDANCNGC